MKTILIVYLFLCAVLLSIFLFKEQIARWVHIYAINNEDKLSLKLRSVEENSWDSTFHKKVINFNYIVMINKFIPYSIETAEVSSVKDFKKLTQQELIDLKQESLIVAMEELQQSLQMRKKKIEHENTIKQILD